MVVSWRTDRVIHEARPSELSRSRGTWRTRNILDSQGQILALAFRQKSSRPVNKSPQNLSQPQQDLRTFVSWDRTRTESSAPHALGVASGDGATGDGVPNPESGESKFPGDSKSSLCAGRGRKAPNGLASLPAVWGEGIMVQGVQFRIPCFGIRNSVFGFRISKSGFQVSGFSLTWVGGVI